MNIFDLFKKFSLIYGEKWQRGAPTEKLVKARIEQWQELLAGCNGPQIQAAYKLCRKHHPTYPPTAFEFVNLVKPDRGAWLGATLPPNYDRPALPSNTPKKTIEEWRDHIRQQVGFKPTHA